MDDRLKYLFNVNGIKFLNFYKFYDRVEYTIVKIVPEVDSLCVEIVFSSKLYIKGDFYILDKELSVSMINEIMAD